MFANSLTPVVPMLHLNPRQTESRIFVPDLKYKWFKSNQIKYGKGGTNILVRELKNKTWSLVLECSIMAHSRKILSDGHYFWCLASIPTWLSFIIGGPELGW